MYDPRPQRVVRPARLLTYVAGCVAFSVGAYLFIHSRLGTDPLDTFALGLMKHMPMTVGVAQTLVAVACLLATAWLTRTRPRASPILTFFACGSLIDVQMALDWARALGPYPALLLGAMVCAYASALIVMSGFGIRAMDLLAIAIRERWHWPFWTGKAAIEGSLFLLGWWLGGPVGVGTVTFFVLVDGLIQPLIWLNTRCLRMRNHGFESLAPQPY